MSELDVDAPGDTVDRLYRAAWALTGDRYEADDLVQDTYAGVLARPRTVQGGQDLPYLLRALVNTHHSRFRRRRRRPAELLRIRETTLTSCLHRARKRVAEQLDPEEARL